MICVICNDPITTDPNGWDGGHNAQPIAEGKCCADCNDRVVIVARLRGMGMSLRDAKVAVARMRYDGLIGV
tara:strand:- start:383 stop:595 length:213 start_codon:yes stop_codon:yes gene_type:complete